MTPTEQLKTEHQAVLVMISVLEKLAGDIQSGEKVNEEHLESIIDFLKIFVDRCHHSKEEDLLFPAMEKAGLPKEGGPIGVMLKEHSLGRDFIKRMTKALENFHAKEAQDNFAKFAQEYSRLLKEHIDKEGNILYPMAEVYIPRVEQKKLLREFDRIEKERIGPLKHQEYHKLMHKLEDLYLK